MARRSRLRHDVRYRKLRFGKRRMVRGVLDRSISGEEFDPAYARISPDWGRFSGLENLMKIEFAMLNYPEVNKQVANMVMKRYGLSEPDWSFVRDEEDPEQIKKYLAIVQKHHKGKFPWEVKS